MKRERGEEDGSSAAPTIRPPSDQTLREFYLRWLPITAPILIHQLGTCCGLFELKRREICLHTKARFDVYSTVQEVLARLPHSPIDAIQFGGIYPHQHLDAKNPRMLERNDFKDRNVRDKHTSPFGELFIDVDLDYRYYDRTNICGCGTGKQACATCWHTFMDPAQMVLEYILNFYGFKRWFKVFSGRRGFHVWIMDERACRMTVPERVSFLTSIMHLVPGEEMCVHIYKMLAPLFDGNPLLRGRFVPPPDKCDYEDAHREAVFKALFPKLDEDVTTKPTHLHKLPLTLHSGTGNLCVVMGSVMSERDRFDYNTDVIHYSKMQDKHVAAGLAQIKRALK